MSELVRKVHTLTRQVVEHEQTIAQWRSNYAAEVNHSEDLARMLLLLHDPCGLPMCSFCNVLREHELRRQVDLLSENVIDVGRDIS